MRRPFRFSKAISGQSNATICASACVSPLQQRSRTEKSYLGGGDMGSRSRPGPLRWTLRVIGGALVVIMAVIAIAFVRFSSWKTEHLQALVAGSQIITTARGDIEYAAEGNGVPHLLIHGSPGGYEHGLAGRRAYPELYADTMSITASRPGFLRTPLESGKTFEEQADLFAALLDSLHIERAVVVAASGGGYIGLQFALRHPQRCIALVLSSPSASHEPDAEGPPPRLMWTPMEFGMWAGGGFVGTMMAKDFDADDSRQVGMLRSLMPLPIAPRVPGALNDGLQRKDPGIDHWPLERISVPTLLIHGDADENSDYAASVRIASKVPGAKLITYKGGDHYIVITHMKEVRAHIDTFVKDVLLEADLQREVIADAPAPQDAELPVRSP
jgi:pimeloyl-ACP methyl ester carboxylesterase